MNNVIKKIISGSSPVEYIRKSVLTLSDEDRTLLKDLEFDKKSEDNFYIIGELTETELIERIGQNVSSLILRKWINNNSKSVDFFIVVYKTSNDHTEYFLKDSLKVDYVLYEFSVKDYDRDEILELQKLYDYIEQDFETDEEIFTMIEKLLRDTEIPRQVEKLMGEEFDIVKYYDENLKPEEYVEIKIWGSPNIRMVEQ